MSLHVKCFVMPSHLTFVVTEAWEVQRMDI